MEKRYFDFTPERAEEEFFLLVGRLEAFAAYVDKKDYINKELIASMLGFELTKKEENEENEIDYAEADKFVKGE